MNGAIEPSEAHRYFLLRPSVDKCLEYFEAGTFFMLYGPRGAGKTTAALHALEEAAELGWCGLVVDMSNLDTSSSAAECWAEFGRLLAGDAAAQGLQLPPITSAATFRAAFFRNSIMGKRVILMLDEFDMLDEAPAAFKTTVSSTSALFW